MKNRNQKSELTTTARRKTTPWPPDNQLFQFNIYVIQSSSYEHNIPKSLDFLKENRC